MGKKTRPLQVIRMKPSQSLELSTALHAAQEATAILLSYYKAGHAGEVVHKGKVDRVSQADLDSEKAMRSILSEAFPGYSIKGEELGESKKESEYTWYIDPLCGSNDFIRGFAEFGLSIALIKNEELILGVCSLPAFQEIYYAEKGFGAYINDEKISVSSVSNLNDSIITTHVSAKVEEVGKPIKLFEKLVSASYVKVPGSFPYAVCSLAKGSSEAHVEMNVAGIHSLAARLIAEEAGAKSSKIDGSPLNIYDEEVLITNGLVHGELLELFN